MKKGVKRLFMLVCVLVLGASLLAGCSSGSQDSSSGDNGGTGSGKGSGKDRFKGQELDVAVFKGGYGADYWEALAKSFEKDYPGTKIHITASPDIGKKIRPKIISGNPPDLVYLNQTNPDGVTQSLIKDHGLTDLTDVFNSKGLDNDKPLKDQILPGILDTAFCSPYGDGKIYIAPYNYNVEGLWYNKNLFNKKHIQPPKTWDDFFALEDTAKKNNRALYTYQASNPAYLEEIVIPAIYSLGGQKALDQFYNYDPEFWKSDTAKKVLGIIQKIADDKNGLMHGTVGMNFTQAQTAFLQGKAMFIQNGNWFEDEMKDAPKEKGFQYGFLGVPPFEKGKKMMAVVAVEQVYIPKDAKNKDLAKEFLKYMYTEKSIRLNGQKAKAVMAVQGAADLVKDDITPTTYDVFSKVEKDMEPVGGTYKALPTGTNIDPRKTFYDQVADVMNHKETADQWADKMYKVYQEAQKALK